MVTGVRAVPGARGDLLDEVRGLGVQLGSSEPGNPMKDFQNNIALIFGLAVLGYIGLTATGALDESMYGPESSPPPMPPLSQSESQGDYQAP
jgi:hypothetical protein